jgi:Zn-dependent protease with chaperone function
LVGIIGLVSLSFTYVIVESNRQAIAQELLGLTKQVRLFFLEYYNILEAYLLIGICLMSGLLSVSIYAFVSYYRLKLDPLSIFPKKLGKTPIFYKPLGFWKILSFLEQPFIGAKLVTYFTNHPHIYAGSLGNVIVINEELLKNLSDDEIRSIVAHEACHFKYHYLQKIHLAVEKRIERSFLCFLSLMIVFNFIVVFSTYNLLNLYSYLYESLGIHEYYTDLIGAISNLSSSTLTIFALYVISLLFIRFAGDYMLEQQELLADAYSAYYTSPKTLISAIKKVAKIATIRYFKIWLDPISFYRPSFNGNKFKRIFFGRHPTYHERLNYVEITDKILNQTISFKLSGKLRSPHSLFTSFLSPSLYFGDLPRFVRHNIPSDSVKSIYEYLQRKETFNIRDCTNSLRLPEFWVLIVVLMLHISKVIKIE